MDSVAILGAGAWGTALAAHLAALCEPPKLRLWTRHKHHAQSLASERMNRRYLPGILLPDWILITSSLDAAVHDASLIIVATPMAALIDTVSALGSGVGVPLFWLGKGFVTTADAAGFALAHRAVAPMWPAPVGVISGPSFAEEVARGLPTAVSVAATDAAIAERAAQRLRGPAFRAYVCDDITGVEVAGAIKNVLAIAAGASDGLGFGNNARAALITRGLMETGRLSESLGGKRSTLMGLAGLGDLVLTCTSDLSRNRRVGLALARGEPLASILLDVGHVAEGVAAARSAHVLAGAHRVEMPICEAVYRVLYEDLPPKRAVAALLAREPAAEFR